MCHPGDVKKGLVSISMIPWSVKKWNDPVSIVQAFTNFLRDQKDRHVMIQVPSYFEAYKHNLVSMSSLEELPLCDFILGWDKNVTDFNLTSIPTLKEKIELDDSQTEAFKSVFKNRISLIQGPPGTGERDSLTSSKISFSSQENLLSVDLPSNIFSKKMRKFSLCAKQTTPSINSASVCLNMKKD